MLECYMTDPSFHGVQWSSNSCFMLMTQQPSWSFTRTVYVGMSYLPFMNSHSSLETHSLQETTLQPQYLNINGHNSGGTIPAAS